MPVSARQDFMMGLGSPEEMGTSCIFRSCPPRAFFMVLLVHLEGGVWVFQVPWIPHCSSPCRHCLTGKSQSPGHHAYILSRTRERIFLGHSSVTHHRSCCEMTHQGLSPCLEYQKKGQCHQKAAYPSPRLAKETCRRSVSSIRVALSAILPPAPDLSHRSQWQWLVSVKMFWKEPGWRTLMHVPSSPFAEVFQRYQRYSGNGVSGGGNDTGVGGRAWWWDQEQVQFVKAELHGICPVCSTRD